MTQQGENKAQLASIIDFLNAPEHDYVIEMDCSDCDTLASLAEQVAAGKPIEQVLPELKQHISYWKDCREEFEGLVAILKAEDDGTLAESLDEIADIIRNGGKQEADGE